MKMNRIAAIATLALGLGATTLANAEHVPNTTDSVRALVSHTLNPAAAKHILAFSDRAAGVVVLTNIACPSAAPNGLMGGGYIALLFPDSGGGALPGCYEPGLIAAQIVWANGYEDVVEFQKSVITELGRRYFRAPE